MNIRQMKAALYTRMAVNRAKFAPLKAVPAPVAPVIAKFAPPAAKPALALVAPIVEPAITAKAAAPKRTIKSIRIDRMPSEIHVPIGTTIKIVIPRASARVQDHLFNMSPKDAGFFDGEVRRTSKGLPQSPIKMASRPAEGIAGGKQGFKDVFIPSGKEAGTTEVWFHTSDGANERFPRVNLERPEGFGNTMKIVYY